LSELQPSQEPNLLEATAVRAEARLLKLEGTYNTRDIGGYRTLDGGLTKWKTVVRSDNLASLAPSAQQALLDYGVQVVIDIRSAWEIQRWPHVFANSTTVRYLNLPLLSADLLSTIANISKQHQQTPTTLLEWYCLYLETCQEQIRLILEVIAQNIESHAPVVVHCSAGKDRTGLIIALLLGLVNVPVAIIADDYALSAAYLSPITTEWRKQAQAKGEDMEQFEREVESKSETIVWVFAYLAKRYQGVRNYLAVIGLTPEQINSLEQGLVAVS
jgi:protein-tyrosine phosphatase